MLNFKQKGLMVSKSALAEIKQAVVDRLKRAPAYLTYHNLAHTLDVAEQALRIAKEEKVSGDEMLLLEVAALYHDIGYLDGPQNHEARGCKIFADEADRWGFSPAEIEIVQRIIMATQVPQSPKGVLEEIICDADLDYLGRSDFLFLAEELKKEYLHFKIVNDNGEWNQLQLHFLRKHHYFTPSQKNLREPFKQKTLASLAAIPE